LAAVAQPAGKTAAAFSPQNLYLYWPELPCHIVQGLQVSPVVTIIWITQAWLYFSSAANSPGLWQETENRTGCALPEDRVYKPNLHAKGVNTKQPT